MGRKSTRKMKGGAAKTFYREARCCWSVSEHHSNLPCPVAHVLQEGEVRAAVAACLFPTYVRISKKFMAKFLCPVVKSFLQGLGNFRFHLFRLGLHDPLSKHSQRACYMCIGRV